MSTLASMIKKQTPAKVGEVLSQSAADGLKALDELVQTNQTLANEVEHLRIANSKLQKDFEEAQLRCQRLAHERDWALRHSARVNAHLSQMLAIMQTLSKELAEVPNAEQIATRFKPQVQEEPSENPS